MQHRYVPDLGDFSKFAVIDALSGAGSDRTALVWYLVDPHEVGDAHKNDGKHTAYLEQDRQGYQTCHPELYCRFQTIHATGEKHVGVYQRHQVLPNLAYFAERLSYDGKALNDREAWRSGWLDRALRVVEGCGMVVLDPDNGLMPPRVSPQSKQAVKYATLDECAAFYGSGKRTLVVYQHAHRQGSATDQARRALGRLGDALGVPDSDRFALRFHRGTTRFYLVVPAKHRRAIFYDRVLALVGSAWGERGHFSLIE